MDSNKNRVSDIDTLYDSPLKNIVTPSCYHSVTILYDGVTITTR